MMTRTRLLSLAVLLMGCAVVWVLSRIGEWHYVASLHTARSHQAAVLLPNGKVLVVGGIGSDSKALASCEIYDPSSDSWNDVTPLPEPIGFPSAELLSTGNVQVLSETLAGFSEFDYCPGTDSWSCHSTVTPPKIIATSTVEGFIFHVPPTGTIGPTAQNGSRLKFGGPTMYTAIRSCLIKLKDGSIFSDDSRDISIKVSDKTKKIDPPYDSGVWRFPVVFTDGAFVTTVYITGAHGREGIVYTVLPSGEILGTGGIMGQPQWEADFDDFYHSHFGRYIFGMHTKSIDFTEVLNPAGTTWRRSPLLLQARAFHSATLLSGGKVLVVGGEQSGNTLASSEIIDAKEL